MRWLLHDPLFSDAFPDNGGQRGGDVAVVYCMDDYYCRRKAADHSAVSSSCWPLSATSVVFMLQHWTRRPDLIARLRCGQGWAGRLKKFRLTIRYRHTARTVSEQMVPDAENLARGAALHGAATWGM